MNWIIWENMRNNNRHYAENPHSAFFMRKIRMFPMRKTPKILTFCVLVLDIWNPIAYNDINNKHSTLKGGKLYVS